MGDIVTKNTAEIVEMQRFWNAPARPTAGQVVPATGSQGFVPAAKRYAVLLPASWVRRGRMELCTLQICWKMADIVPEALPRKCDKIASGTPPCGTTE